jgi:hypothetical protein
MAIEVSEYLDVHKRVLELDCNFPTGIAILPSNFADAKTKGELYNASDASTVRALWKQAGVVESRLEKEGDRFPSLHLNAAEWYGPAIFVGAQLWNQNPAAVTIALNVISNYLTDWLKGVRGKKDASLDIVVQKTKSGKFVVVKYNGTAEGMKTLPAILREVADRE